MVALEQQWLIAALGNVQRLPRELPAAACSLCPSYFPPPCPVPGKGPSEFFYSWVPLVAPFAGGAIAGGFYMAVQKMNHSAVP